MTRPPATGIARSKGEGAFEKKNLAKAPRPQRKAEQLPPRDVVEQACRAGLHGCDKKGLIGKNVKT